jgi:hypothetical protein
MDLKTLSTMPPWEWPEDAATIILGVLRDEKVSPSDREVAASLAGDGVVINDELVDALLSVVSSPRNTETLRGGAAIALGPALEQADLDELDDFEDPALATVTIDKIKTTLHKLYMDSDLPVLVRRRILEASVRAPQDWQRDAIRAAYASDDQTWKLTAVFCMRFVSGFDQPIMEALGNPDPEIHYEAVHAAGNWSLAAAWPHVVALVSAPSTDKELLLAAIEAVAGIRPQEAAGVLEHLVDSGDEEIADAVQEALALSEFPSTDDEDADTDQAARRP